MPRYINEPNEYYEPESANCNELPDKKLRKKRKSKTKNSRSIRKHHSLQHIYATRKRSKKKSNDSAPETLEIKVASKKTKGTYLHYLKGLCLVMSCKPQVSHYAISSKGEARNITDSTRTASKSDLPVSSSLLARPIELIAEDFEDVNLLDDDEVFQSDERRENLFNDRLTKIFKCRIITNKMAQGSDKSSG